MSPEEVLACDTPFALFGEAVRDRRALKRAYATWIRQYDPDGHPRVFAHIRALYEAARRGDTGAPEPTDADPGTPSLRLVTDDPAPAPVPEPSPSPDVRLQEAMKEARADEALELLHQHDLDIRIDAPDVWFASVATLADARTFQLPAATLRSWLAAIESPPEHVPEPLLDRIELLTNTGLAFHEASLDPEVSPEVLALLRHWGEGPIEVAKAFMALSEALPDPEEAFGALALVRDRYPALWFPFTLMTNVVTREVDHFDETTSELLAQEPPEELQEALWTDGGSTLRGRQLRGLLVVPCALFLVLFWATSWLHAWTALAISAVVLVGSGAALAICTQFALSGPRSYPEVHALLVRYARRHTLFDTEVLDLALSGGEDPPAPALLRWQRDPTTLMRVLTAAHLARIAARLASTAAEGPRADTGEAPPPAPPETAP